MDSVSQLLLGSAVGVAVMGRRTSVAKAAAWGAVCGTLPDLDTFIDFGDAVRNMTAHRAESHALFYLSAVAPLIAWLIAWLHGEMDRFRRWWLAVWLALVTHPLLDAMTVYGTRLALPFDDHPFGVGSMFIIDPAYTLPLLAGVVVALVARGSPRGLRWNAAGLALSALYLAWSAVAQQHVLEIARASLRTQGIEAERVLATPAPLNTLLWRVIAITPDEYREGFYSVLDAKPEVRFDAFPRGRALYDELRDNDAVRRIARFSGGFFKLSQEGTRLLITDLRMGQEPNYAFSFVVAERASPPQPLAKPERIARRLSFSEGLPWLWRRMRGEPVPPPR